MGGWRGGASRGGGGEAASEGGRLPGGSKLGGEVELATRLGISRPTMRAAMKQLVDKGLLLRRRGIGTMVAPRPVRRAVALTSLYDDLKEAGREPRPRLLSLERGQWPPGRGAAGRWWRRGP